MLRIKNWWWSLVASSLVARERETHRLFLEATDQNLILKKDIDCLEKPSLVGSWVASQAHASKMRINELELQLSKTGLLRDALRNEKAYTLFLEDCLECKNPSDVFNALPLEKRKEYFDKVQ